MKHKIERTTQIDGKAVKLSAEFKRDVPTPGTAEWNALFENDRAQDQFLRAAVGKKHKQMASNYLFVKKTSDGLDEFMAGATIDEVVSGKTAKIDATTDEVAAEAAALGIDPDKAADLLARLKVKTAAVEPEAYDAPPEASADAETEPVEA